MKIYRLGYNTPDQDHPHVISGIYGMMDSLPVQVSKRGSMGTFLTGPVTLKSHPLPYDDGCHPSPHSFYNSGYFCGFESLDQFREWFLVDLHLLNDILENHIQYFNEFVSLCVYEVPEECVNKGRRQLTFDPQYAVLVEELDFIQQVEEFLQS